MYRIRIDTTRGLTMATLAALYNDEALVENVTEHVRQFIDKRFEGLTPELQVIMTEVCTEMFVDGATWAGRDDGQAGKIICNA